MESKVEAVLREKRRLGRRAAKLIYALVVSIIGLPVGFLLELPYVWILSIIGIVASLILLSRNARDIERHAAQTARLQQELE